MPRKRTPYTTHAMTATRPSTIARWVTPFRPSSSGEGEKEQHGDERDKNHVNYPSSKDTKLRSPGLWVWSDEIHDEIVKLHGVEPSGWTKKT